MITGKNYKRVLNSVFPNTKERRVDLLLELEDNSILHIEFQTSNDKDMLYRMLEYYSRDLSIILCLITKSPVEYL